MYCFNDKQCPKCGATHAGHFGKDIWMCSVHASSAAVRVRHKPRIRFLWWTLRDEHVRGHCHACGANWPMECRDSMAIYGQVMQPDGV